MERLKELFLEDTGKELYERTGHGRQLSKAQEEMQSLQSEVIGIAIGELPFVVPHYGATQVLTMDEFRKLSDPMFLKNVPDRKYVVLLGQDKEKSQEYLKASRNLESLLLQSIPMKKALAAWVEEAVTGKKIKLDKSSEEFYSHLKRIEEDCGKIAVIFNQRFDVSDINGAMKKLGEDISEKSGKGISYLIKIESDNKYAMLEVINGDIQGRVIQLGNLNVRIISLDEFRRLRSFGDKLINDYMLTGKPLVKESSFELIRDEYKDSSLDSMSGLYLARNAIQNYQIAQHSYLEIQQRLTNTPESMLDKVNLGPQYFQIMSAIIEALSNSCLRRRYNQSNHKITVRQMMDNPSSYEERLLSEARQYLREIISNQADYSRGKYFIENAKKVIDEDTSVLRKR